MAWGSSSGVMQGYVDNGSSKTVPVTGEGHLEVAIHDPLTTFGEVSVAFDTPVFQTDFIYQLNQQQCLTVVSGTGTATIASQMLNLSTGTTINSFAVAESRKRLRYRPGQGIKQKFTAIYTTPVASSYQCVGCGTAENGAYFGYGDTNNLSDTSFGVLYVRGGIREIKTITVTTKATSATNITVTLNAVPFTVPVTDATAFTLQRTVWEVATFAGYTGWDAYANGATIVFIRKSAGVTAGTQSISAGSSGAAGSIAQTRVGVASTDTFYKQSDWNIDKLNGSGSSGFTINPQKINIFRIKIGFLGAHDIIFQVKVTPPNSNNSIWTTCHIIKYANLNTQVNFTNASFPFNAFAYSAGSTTNLTVKCGSFAGVIEGKKMMHGPQATYTNSLTTVGATNYQAIVTVMNPRVYAGVSNQSVINILGVTGALKHTSPCIFYLIKNGALAGNPTFTTYSTSTSGLWDIVSTTVTPTTNDQIIDTFHLGDTGNFDIDFAGYDGYNAQEITIQPGEWITLCAKAVTGTPAYVTGSLNTREDQ